jgi:hypothetical protein
VTSSVSQDRCWKIFQTIMQTQKTITSMCRMTHIGVYKWLFTICEVCNETSRWSDYVRSVDYTPANHAPPPLSIETVAVTATGLLHDTEPVTRYLVQLLRVDGNARNKADIYHTQTATDVLLSRSVNKHIFANRILKRDFMRNPWWLRVKTVFNNSY